MKLTNHKMDTNYLVCFRVSDRSPKLASQQDVCSQCGEAVWRAYSNPTIKFTVLCQVCAQEMMLKAEESGETTEIQPPTAEQLKDIEEYEQRQRQGN